MNRRQVILLVIAGLVLGGAGLYLNRQRTASFTSTERTAVGRLLGDFPINDVALVTLRQQSNEVNLVKADAWTVRERSGYPASADEIVGFVRKLWDLRPAQSQKIGPSQLGRLNLLQPDAGGTNTGLLIELKAADGKKIRSVLLGLESVRGGENPGSGGWPNGRWLYLPDQPGNAYVVSETFTEIEPNPERWLKKDFFRIEKAKTLAVEFPAATNSWKLTRETETGEWKLADAGSGEQLDPAKIAALASPLSAPSFSDVTAGGTPDSTGTNQPTVVKIETFDGFAYTVNVGAKTNEEYFLTVAVTAQLTKERTPGKDEKPEDKAKLDKEFKDKLQKLEDKLKQEQSLGKWTYRVAGWTLEPLLKGRLQLLVEKKEEPKAAEGSTTNSVNPGAPASPGNPK